MNIFHKENISFKNFKIIYEVENENSDEFNEYISLYGESLNYFLVCCVERYCSPYLAGGEKLA